MLLDHLYCRELVEELEMQLLCQICQIEMCFYGVISVARKRSELLWIHGDDPGVRKSHYLTNTDVRWTV